MERRRNRGFVGTSVWNVCLNSVWDTMVEGQRRLRPRADHRLQSVLRPNRTAVDLHTMHPRDGLNR